MVPEEWSSPLLQAYRPLLGPTVNRSAGVAAVEAAGTARVNHLMGLPVDTRSGPVLQVTQGEDIRTGRQQSYSTSSGAGSASLSTPAWLTVIQVTPVDGPFHRDASAAALTRRLALDVQRETGGWVLALPAVPAAVAEEIWRALGAFAGLKQTPRRWNLVACVGEIKSRIVESGAGQPDATPPDGAAAHQVAQDVLLIGPWSAS